MATRAKRSDEGSLKAALDVRKLHKDLERDVLVKNLKELSICLTDFKQTDQKKYPLTDVSAALVSPALFHHKSKEVRLYVACCLADVLRVYAPNPPYSVPQLKSIFDLFFDQLKGIANAASPSFPSYLYLLENFSLVNTPLILVELESDDMLVKMFNFFFDLTQKDLAPRITSYLQTILHACLNECENISLRLLFTILIHIVPPLKHENPAGYQLAINLIRRCDQVLDRPIAGYIRDVVIEKREPEEVEDGLKSRLLDDPETQLEVVYELCAQNSPLMIPLHPDLQDLMETSDASERLKWVDVFGRVFTADETGLAIKFPQLLLSFLKRFMDVDVNVRVKMAEYGHLLLVKHEAHRDAICDFLLQRTLDKDDRVRKAVCVSVCGAARDKPTAVSLNLLNAIGKRTLDKKVHVRQEAIEGMAQLFRVHCAEFWKNGEALPKVAKKFSWIPRKLILSTTDTTTKMLVEKVFDEDVLDVHYSVQERTRCLIGIFASLEPRSKKSFLNLLQNKKHLQTLVNDLLDLEIELKKSSADDAVKRKRAVRVLEIVKQFTESNEDDKMPKKMTDLFNNKDKHTHKWLRTLASPLSDYASLRLAQDELARAVSSAPDKKAAKKKDTLAWHLSIRVSMTMLPCDSIPMIFEQAQENLANNRAILSLAALELATALAENFTPMMTHANAIELLIPLAEAKNEEVSRSALKVMALCPPGGTTKAVMADAVAMARGRVFSGNGAQAKYAARIVSNLTSTENMDFSTKKAKNSNPVVGLFKESLKALSLDTEGEEEEENRYASLECAFAALGEIGKAHPSLVLSEFEKINDFLVEDLLLSPSAAPSSSSKSRKSKSKRRKKNSNKQGEEEGDAEEEGDEVEEEEDDQEKKVRLQGDTKLPGKVAGIKSVVNLLLASAKRLKDDEDVKRKIRTLSTPFMRVLLLILQKQGNLGDEFSEDEEVREQEAKDCGVLVSTAAKGVLKLCSNPIFERQMTAVPSPSASAASKAKTYDPFLHLALVAHHEQPDVRQRFIDYLAEKISLYQLPFSYTCILALCASHEKNESTKIQNLLTRLIGRQRDRWRMQQSLAGAAEKAILNHSLPELVLSNLIYLLSYHPDFQDDDDKSQSEQRVVYDYFLDFPKFFLECLFSGKGAHDNNYTLVSDILEVIRNSEDIRNPGNLKLYKLAELTRASLRDLYQGKDFSGSKHPGIIVLPPSLYGPRSSKPKLKYLPSWYSFKKPHSAVPATSAAIAAAAETKNDEESTVEKKEKPAASTRKKKRTANDTPMVSPTRVRLPRHAKDTAPRTLEYDSGDDSEFDRLADDAAVPEDPLPMEDSEDDKSKSKPRKNSNNEETSSTGKRTPAKGKTSKKSQSRAKDEEEEYETEDEKATTKSKTSKRSMLREKEEEEAEKSTNKGKTSSRDEKKAQVQEKEKKTSVSKGKTSKKSQSRAKDDEEEEPEEEQENVSNNTANKKSGKKESSRSSKKDESEVEEGEESVQESLSAKKKASKRNQSKSTEEEELTNDRATPKKGGKSQTSKSESEEEEGEEAEEARKKADKRQEKRTKSNKSKTSKSEDEQEEVQEGKTGNKKGKSKNPQTDDEQEEELKESQKGKSKNSKSQEEEAREGKKVKSAKSGNDEEHAEPRESKSSKQKGKLKSSKPENEEEEEEVKSSKQKSKSQSSKSVDEEEETESASKNRTTKREDKSTRSDSKEEEKGGEEEESDLPKTNVKRGSRRSQSAKSEEEEEAASKKPPTKNPKKTESQSSRSSRMGSDSDEEMVEATPNGKSSSKLDSTEEGKRKSTQAKKKRIGDKKGSSKHQEEPDGVDGAESDSEKTSKASFKPLRRR